MTPPTDPDALYRWQERVAIKMDSGIPQDVAERQATEEQRERVPEQMRLAR